MTSRIALAFIGTAVPDEPAYRTTVFHRGGNNFQLQLVGGLAREGISDIEVFSARPILSYPRSSNIWIPSRREHFGEIPVRLLPFLNVTPLKQLGLGVYVLFGLARWGWRKRKIRDRVVLTYNLTVPPGLFTLLGAKVARARAVVSVNDINIPGETVPTSLLWRLDVKLQRWLLPRFDGHLVVSDAIADDFIPGRPYVRIEGGVDTQFLERTRRDRPPRANSSPFVFAFAGWLNEANGVRILLTAFDTVRRPDFRLRIAGAGPLQAIVEEAARRNPRIEYLGMLDATAVADMYQTADVLLNIRLTKAMNTRYFFPGKLIEYFASGVPTITTNVARVEEEFSELAYILIDESPQGLAELLTFVASRSPAERLTISEKARAHVANTMSWDVQAAKLASYIREVVLSNPSGRAVAASGRSPTER